MHVDLSVGILLVFYSKRHTGNFFAFHFSILEFTVSGENCIIKVL